MYEYVGKRIMNIIISSQQSHTT